MNFLGRGQADSKNDDNEPTRELTKNNDNNDSPMIWEMFDGIIKSYSFLIRNETRELELLQGTALTLGSCHL